jgi:hypothetical protein
MQANVHYIEEGVMVEGNRYTASPETASLSACGFIRT